MKKILFSFLSLLTVLTVPGYSEWVLLERFQDEDVANVTFLSFTTADYDDYIFIIDAMEPTNSAYNIVMQVGLSDGISPLHWITSYSGGVSTFRAGATEIVSTQATSAGIPITNVANEGASFIGDLRIANTGFPGISNSPSYGPVGIHGTGLFGTAGSGFIYGTLNGAGNINCVRFVSLDPAPMAPQIQKVDISVYGLRQTPVPD